MYNIAQSIHDRVKRISQMDESQYEAFLSALEDEATAYITLSLKGDYEKLEDEQKMLLKSFYIQYSMFSKLENEAVAQDKLTSLNRLIKSINEKLSDPNKAVKVL